MMKYKIYVSEIHYGSVTVEADSKEEAVDKFYSDDMKIQYYDSEISDVDAQELAEKECD